MSKKLDIRRFINSKLIEIALEDHA